jgi:hypothetical protein
MLILLHFPICDVGLYSNAEIRLFWAVRDLRSVAETFPGRIRTPLDEKVSRAAFGGQLLIRADQERLRDETGRLGTSVLYL